MVVSVTTLWLYPRSKAPTKKPLLSSSCQTTQPSVYPPNPFQPLSSQLSGEMLIEDNSEIPQNLSITANTSPNIPSSQNLDASQETGAVGENPMEEDSDVEEGSPSIAQTSPNTPQNQNSRTLLETNTVEANNPTNLGAHA
jgi:hypothetical protein